MAALPLRHPYFSVYGQRQTCDFNQHFNQQDLSISNLAFADDVVLLAESPKILQRLTTKYCEELAVRGLQVNPGRCASLYVKVRKSKGGRTQFVPPRPCLKINAEEIPHMGIAET